MAPKLPLRLPTLMRCHPEPQAQSVFVCVSEWVGEGLSLCALFCVGYSVEKSPHSPSFFCWWTTLARRAEGQTAEITAADEACDSRPRPFCLDNYSQHTEAWKCSLSWEEASMGMNGHWELLEPACVQIAALERKCVLKVTPLQIFRKPHF